MANTFSNSKVIGNEIWMKEWFYRKNYSEYGEYVSHVCYIVKETEKAYRVHMYNMSNGAEIWIPKSCTLGTVDEMISEAREAEKRQLEWEAKRQARFEAACKAYAELIEYARANGVRGVREGLRRETIENKIKAAGLPLPA